MMLKKKLEQFVRDCNFLRDHNIMDYSLLVGVVVEDSMRNDQSGSTNNGEEERKNDHGPKRPHSRSTFQMQGKYYIGMIDILQAWNWGKWREHWAKRMLGHWNDYHKLSAVEPQWYCDRFILKIGAKFQLHNEDRKKEILLNKEPYQDHLAPDRPIKERMMYWRPRGSQHSISS